MIRRRECWPTSHAMPGLRFVCHGLVLLACAGWAHAGEFNTVLSIGDAAPAWQDLPGTDGRRHGLAELRDKPLVVVIFTCASCPTAVDYEGRIGELVNAHGGPEGPVAVVPICVNRVAADQLPALTKRVTERSLNFHYLYDETQRIAKDYGAIFTPEFYLLDRDRKVVYMGALDDATDPAMVKVRYLEAAIEANLAGKTPEITETIARGCRVRYARERRE